MERNSKIYKEDLLYPELSYKIIGILFDVFTNLGYGFKENQYQKAVEIAFKKDNILYKKEYPIKIFYQNDFLTLVYLDFLIEDKIVLELKQGNLFYKKDIDQLYNYLKATNLKLGLLARFTRLGVKYKRVVNNF